MQDFVSWLVKQIVDEPDAVIVEKKDENGGILLNLSVAAPDMGKVIGKEGKVIKAIRNLLKIKAVKENKQSFSTNKLINLQLVEPEQKV